MVRGSGNVIDPHAVEDYEVYNSTIAEGSATIDGVETQVYNMEMMSSTITVALSASVSSVSIGGTVVLTATVLDEETPVTGENVTFKAGTSVLGTATTDSNGVATYNYVTDTVGFFSLTAVYSNVISTPVSLTVNKITPTVVLTANSSTVCIDEGVTLTATVKNGNIGIPGITVNFKREGFDAGSVTTDSNGVATLSLTLATGTHTLNCSTVATDNYNSANSSDVSVTVTLIPTTTSLSLSQSTIYVDGSSTASATLLVRSTPLSGAVIVFYDGTSIVGSALTNSNGVATYSLSGLTAGSHSITAHFAGGQNREQSTSTAQTLTVLDHSYSLAFSQSSYPATSGSATLELTLLDNSVPVSGATVGISGSDSSSYTGLTNSQGIASVTVSNISSLTTFTASYSNVSAQCTVDIQSYLFYDDCSSASGLSQYGSSVLIRGTNATCNLSYDSNNNCYALSGSGNYHSAIPIPVLNDKNNYSIEADFKCGVNHELNTIGFVIRDYNNTSIQSKSFQLKGNGRFRDDSYLITTDRGYTINESISYSAYNYWVHMRLEITGTSVKVELSYNGTIFKTYNLTTETITNRQVGLFLFCERGTTNSKCYVKNIKAEAL